MMNCPTLGFMISLKAGGRLDEAALSLGAEPVAVAADGQHVTVVQGPVEIAVAITESANTVPHSATLRFDVISMAPVW
jgi:hypothetical protein